MRSDQIMIHISKAGEIRIQYKLHTLFGIMSQEMESLRVSTGHFAEYPALHTPLIHGENVEKGLWTSRLISRYV